MTIDELLVLARDCDHNAAPESSAQLLGSAVLDLLGESDRCGFESPDVALVAGERKLFPSATWCAWISPDDARAMARMLLRAADESEAKEYDDAG